MTTIPQIQHLIKSKTILNPIDLPFEQILSLSHVVSLLPKDPMNRENIFSLDSTRIMLGNQDMLSEREKVDITIFVVEDEMIIACYRWNNFHTWDAVWADRNIHCQYVYIVITPLAYDQLSEEQLTQWWNQCSSVNVPRIMIVIDHNLNNRAYHNAQNAQQLGSDDVPGNAASYDMDIMDIIVYYDLGVQKLSCTSPIFWRENSFNCCIDARSYSYFCQIASQPPLSIYLYVKNLLQSIAVQNKISDLDYLLAAYALENDVIKDALCLDLYSSLLPASLSLYQAIVHIAPIPALILLALGSYASNDKFLASAYIACAIMYTTKDPFRHADSLAHIVQQIVIRDFPADIVQQYTLNGATQAYKKLLDL